MFDRKLQAITMKSKSSEDPFKTVVIMVLLTA